MALMSRQIENPGGQPLEKSKRINTSIWFNRIESPTLSSRRSLPTISWMWWKESFAPE
jgi:hypothetical protein